MGEAPRQANAAKIACNMMITMAIEAMAEAVVLTESQGVGREAFFDVILNTLFGGRAYQTYSANSANSAYDPGFRARLGLKDLRLAAEAAQMALAGPAHAGSGQGTAWPRRWTRVLGERDWSIIADFTINHGR